MMNPSDPHNLARFLVAQEPVYATVLGELKRGRKETHWMWFIFPQIIGLGGTEMASRYGIHGLDEARAYLAHPVLGPRLLECAETVLSATGSSAEEIFGQTDSMKLRSSATLFGLASPPASVFRRVLDRYCDGSMCQRTVESVQRG